MARADFDLSPWRLVDRTVKHSVDGAETWMAVRQWRRSMAYRPFPGMPLSLAWHRWPVWGPVVTTRPYTGPLD